MGNPNSEPIYGRLGPFVSPFVDHNIGVTVARALLMSKCSVAVVSVALIYN